MLPPQVAEDKKVRRNERERNIVICCWGYLDLESPLIDLSYKAHGKPELKGVS